MMARCNTQLLRTEAQHHKKLSVRAQMIIPHPVGDKWEKRQPEQPMQV